MELQQRIAQARATAGLTLPQLAERIGVPCQDLSAWESGHAVPDLAAAARLCRALCVSADYLLLGQEAPAEEGPKPAPPVVCPCCGAATPAGNVCISCGYPDLRTPDTSEHYALVAYRGVNSPVAQAAVVRSTRFLSTYCGMGDAAVNAVMDPLFYTSAQYQAAGRAVLRRDLPAAAALWMAAHRPVDGFDLNIVQDRGEPDGELLYKHIAMALPPRVDTPEEAAAKQPLSFPMVVGAVVLGVIAAIVILSLF